MELEMDFLTSRILSHKTYSYKCQFCTKVCASSRLAVLISQDKYKEKVKHKEKVPDVSYSNQNIEITCNSKLKFSQLKDLLIKREQKN